MQQRDYQQEINQFESHYSYDSTYMRELLTSSPVGYEKFDAFMPLVAHREHLTKDVFWVARLSVMQFEDCGHCLQLNVRMALEDGVEAAIVRAAIQGGKSLPDHLRSVHAYARQVANNQREPTLFEQMSERFNQAQRLELGLCIATTRVFPTIKRTLGYTKACQLINIEVA